MDIKEIRAIFEDKCTIAYMDRKEEIPIIGQYIGNILDVIITINGCKITIFCSEHTIIECVNEHPNSHIGIDDTLIEPIKDIESIQVNWR